jgi:amino acid adenylation domain-containing protein
MAIRLQAVFAGRGALLLRCAEEWVARGHDVAAVISDEAAVRAWAGQRSFPALTSGAGALPDSDFHVLIGHPEDSHRAWSRPPRRRIVVYQDSLLPAYAGWHATTWALFNQEKAHGVTWYTPDAAGPLALQRGDVPVTPDDTAFSLDTKCFDAALSAFARLVADLEQEREAALPALDLPASFYGEFQRPPAACLIDFTRPAAELAALARALSFADRANPLGLPKLWLGHEAVVVREIEVAAAPAGAAPGTIIALDAHRVTVSTADGAVAMRAFTALSGAARSLEALMRDYSWRVGSVLPLWPSAVAPALTSAHEALAPHEQFWVQRLAAVQPFVLPFATPVTADATPRWSSLPVALSGTKGPAAEVLAAHAAFLLRVADGQEIDVEWQADGAGLGVAGFEVLAAAAVPLTVAADFGDRFADSAARLAAQMDDLSAHRTFLRDLGQRYPELRGASRPSVGLAIAPLRGDPDASTVLRVEVAADGGACTWRFNEDAWPRERAQQVAGLFTSFLQNLKAQTGTPWRKLALVGEAERELLLDRLVGVPNAGPVDRDLAERIEAVARATPDAPAVIYQQRVLSYRELNGKANQMAALLRARGAGPDTRIGLFMDRSPETMVALLGVLKAGSCYVPIDPAYPRERVLYMMENAQMALLLTQPHLKDALPPSGRELVVVDPSFTVLQGQPEDAVASGAGPDHLGYVIYTSGSTGAPKGVAMTRRALLNLVAWQNGVSTPGPGVRTFQFASLSFDVSFQEMFSTWSSGGTLVLVPEEMRRDPMQLLRLARESQVQRWFMPYAALQQIAAAADAAGDYPESLRDVITAGEALRITPEIRRLFQHLPACRLHNQYGPSETHVATAYILPPDPAIWPELPPIGRPIAATRIVLLDGSGDPVPEGFPGELLIGGACLARGYLLQPERTSERFVNCAWPGRPSERFYRTGDLARVTPEGQLEFLGRRDDQVKIRGYRVELGEVEAALSRHPQVRECAVVARERGGVRQLIAYAVVRDAACGTRELRAHLQGLLPEFMMPAAFVFLDQLPLTPSGKIHRRGLPEPSLGRPALESSYQPPQSDVERILGHLWQQVLGLDRVGVADNFFDLGGDSLKLAKVQAALRTSLRREVPILDLFRYPTIASLAQRLSGSEAEVPAARRRRVRPAAGDDAIAVVGLAGRYPGADNIEQLWANLCGGRESITFFGDDEVAGSAPPAGSGLKFIKARAVLEKCEWFDAGLFGYGPRDAELMDPQHRVFLECAWEALEHAGLDPARYEGAIGVYAAASLNTYLMYNVLGNRAAVDDMMTAFQVGGYQTLIGNDKDYVATRVAYKLNLRGPSMSIQSACSSSLVAVCQACQSLVAGACDVALAGGVSITFPQKRGYLYVEGSIASSDGHCRPFDANASGTVFGSGAGIVVLKRLADAQADGDTIYAVLKGWALNNDGALKAGFMAPSVEGQADVIRMAQERAGVDARTIGYVETHGTGTPLGDPIEVAGLTRAFRLSTSDAGFCALGSLKANIGHLESAAGVTGLIKAVLALHRGQIPPLLHFERPNPLIDLPSTPFYASPELLPWPTSTSPRRAAVSSFGVGGTNAHVVLEEAPPAGANAAAKPAQLLLVSARTEAAFAASVANLADFVLRRGEDSLAPVAYTLQTGRAFMERRGFVVAREPADALAGLRASGGLRSVKAPGRAPAVVFVFPGQGSQHVDMGRGLYETEPVFRQHLDECAALLKPQLELGLDDLLYPDASRRAECQELLTQTRYAQPYLFAVEYALARWWMARGVQPAAMIGHSAGEYVAAVLMGVFSLPDALKVLVKRGQLMQAQPPGRMLAVRLTAEEVQPYLDHDLSLAAANAPSMSVISGPSAAVEELNRTLEAKGIGGRLLQTSHAFHSDMMTPALEPFRRVLEAVTLHAPSRPFLSTRSGGWLEPAEVAKAEYWVRQIREPVQFSRAVREAQKQAGAVFLEVGPHQALTTLALQHDAPEAPVTAIPSLRHTRENLSDYESLLRAVGRLWTVGQDVDWAGLHDGRPPRRIALPTYPFERKRYWIEPPKAVEAGATAGTSYAAEPEAAAESSGPGESAPVAAKPAAGVLDQVLDILQDLSGIGREAILPERPFLEMGFDSLFLTQVSLAFQRRFLVKLTLRQMLEDLSSPAAIAEYLAAQMPAQAAPASAADTPVPVPAPASSDKLSLAQTGPFTPEAQAVAAPAPVRHGPYAPINKAAGDALTPRQQVVLEALIARYTKKTARSKEHTQKNRAHFADPRAVSGFRVQWKEMIYPIVSARSGGSKIWDLDGNEYLDVTMGFGTNLFGHNPEFIRQAVQEQLAKGIEIGPQSAVAGDVARMICEITGLERATFCNTGSEAVMGAVRAARTVTGRQRIVYFAGDYHGVNDEVLAKGQTFQGRMRTVPIAPGIPTDMVSQVQVLPYGDPASLDWLRAQAGQLAAVLVEPVQSRKPQLQPKAFLQEVREITRQAGTALIFDEVITGFRVHPGGAQAWFGVKADLATYGKIIGGGLPIGVIAGARAYLDAFDGGFWQYGDNSVPEAGVTFFAGTFVRHPLAMAAAQAVLLHLRAGGPELQRTLNERTGRFTAEANQFFEAEGIDLRINNFGSLWYFSHGERFKYFSLMFHFLRDLGVHIWEGRPCFLSTAHSEEDVARLVAAFKQAMNSMREGGFLPERDVVVPASGPYPLSEAQQEIWLASRLDPQAAPAFNESCALTFRGPFRSDALTSALGQLVERHEALRTSISASGETQVVHPATPPFLAVEDLSGLGQAARDQRLAASIREEVQQPFDLTRTPLLRGRLFKLAAEEHVLALTAHHIVCDGWSYDVMVRDLGVLYSQACCGERDQRPPPTQFRDYAQRMAAYRREARYDADLAFWMDRLAAPPTALQLPLDRTRPPLRSFQGAMDVAQIEEPLYSALKELGTRQRCTFFATLMAIYAVLLHRLSGQSDLIIGIPAAGQQLMEGQDLVGHCANLLPLRLHIEPERPFTELLAATQRALLDAYEHQGLTFGALLKALQLPRDPSRSPLIQVTFNVDPAIHGLQFEGLETGIVINPRTAYQFEHSLNLVAHAGHLRVETNYNTDLFDQATVARWAGHLREIARAATQSPELAVEALPLLTAAERRQVTVGWNPPVAPYPAQLCLHELFAQQAARTPDAVAVVCEKDRLTYADLEQRANQLAHYLRRQGVGAESLVGLAVERSLELVVGILGILKAGGAYLPLDPTYPAERLAFMLADAQVKVVLTQARLKADLPASGARVICLDADWPTVARETAAPPSAVASPDHLAYVIYTSGSTGRPKGALVTHRNVVRLFRATEHWFGFGPADVWTLFHSYAFDFSVWELWGALLYGGRLVVVPYLVSRDPVAFHALLRRERVTVLNQTPSAFRQLSWAEESRAAQGELALRYVIFGGEALDLQSLRPWFARHGDRMPQLVNMYGITETTVHVTYRPLALADVEKGSGSMIGRPIPDLQVYVVDRHLQPVPIGVPGELLVGGAGVARGYLSRPELTAERFIAHPLAETAGQVVYRTGDLARFLPDGDIEYLGRIDQQVKIRGFRIELGEIESILVEQPAVREAAVLAFDNAQGEKQLAAYVVAKANVAGDAGGSLVADLRARLRARLPEYMVPATFVLLESLPLTPTGKVDRRALPDPAEGATPTAGAYVAPRTEEEIRLAAIWADILNLPRVSATDDFFAVGGHSLSAIKLITRLGDAGYQLEVVDLFRHPVLERMAKVMKPMAAASVPAQGDVIVVRLQEGRPGRPPLCLLPSDFGDLLIYTNLMPLLNPDLPCLGLQCARMYENNQDVRSMPDLARFFIKHLLSVQPQGPYLLAGYCFGGLVALEMARILKAEGREVALLCLIDARPYNPAVERGEYWRMLLQGALRAKASDWKRHIAAKISMKREGMLIDMMARTNPDRLGRRELNRWVLETKAMNSYRCTPYDGTITYFYPQESQYEIYGDPSCGWLHLAERVNLYKVSGSHLNMMKEPHVRQVASQLQACVDRVTGGASR